MYRLSDPSLALFFKTGLFEKKFFQSNLYKQSPGMLLNQHSRALNSGKSHPVTDFLDSTFGN